MPRPTDYTDKLAEEICVDLMQGKSLRACCEVEGRPHYITVLRWVHEDRGGFATKYAHAREVQAGFYAEEQIEISDTDENAAKARNRMLARQWYASKMDRARFGDKVQQEISGPDGGALKFEHIKTPEDLDAEIARLQALVGK